MHFTERISCTCQLEFDFLSASFRYNDNTIFCIFHYASTSNISYFMNISQQIGHTSIFCWSFQSEFISLSYSFYCKSCLSFTRHYLTGCSFIYFIDLNLYIFLQFIINGSIYSTNRKQSILSYKYRQWRKIIIFFIPYYILKGLYFMFLVPRFFLFYRFPITSAKVRRLFLSAKYLNLPCMKCRTECTKWQNGCLTLLIKHPF